jgi:ankyrin repeat protein
MMAARKGDSKLAERLLRDGANIEARDETGLTPLAVAIDYGNPETAELLLAKGAVPLMRV